MASILTDDQREQLMTLSAFVHEQMHEILGEGADVVMIAHPPHTKDGECQGICLLTSAPLEQAAVILGQGMANVGRMLSAGAAAPADSTKH